MTAAAPHDSDARLRLRGRSVGLLLLGLLLLAALLFAVGDLRAFVTLLREVRPLPLAVSLLLTAASYVAFHASVLAYGRAAGVTLPALRSFPVTVVSQAVNNLVSSGGIGGTAIRAVGYAKLGCSPGTAAGISGMATLASDLVMLLGVFVALFAAALGGHASTRVAAWSGAGFAGTLLATALFLVAMHAPSRRLAAGRLFLRLVAPLERRLGPRLGGATAVERFRLDAGAAFAAVLARPASTLLPNALSAVDLFLRGAALAAAYHAIGRPVALSVAESGWFLGITASTFSLVPGGVGVLEASTAGTISWLGVPLATAAAASVVYRFAFYVAPMLVALPLTRTALLRAATREAAPSA